MFRLNMFKSKLIIWIVHVYCLLLVVEQVTAEAGILCFNKLVVAVCGSSIVLQCHLEPQQDATHNTVKWSQQDDVVHVHQGGKDIPVEQSERFEDRTSLFSEGLSRGNLSLQLSHLKLSDSGRYKCSFQAGSVEKSCYIALSVGEYEVMGSSEPVTAESGQDVILPCHLEPPFDLSALTVEWKYNEIVVHYYRDLDDNSDVQDKRFKDRTFLFHDEMVNGSFSLKLSKVTEEDAGIYTCFILEPTCRIKRANVTLKVGKKDEDPDKRVINQPDKPTSSADPAHPDGHTIGLVVCGLLGFIGLAAVIAGVVCFILGKCPEQCGQNNGGQTNTSLRESTQNPGRRSRLQGQEAVPLKESNQNDDDQDGRGREQDNNSESEPLNELNQDNDDETSV